MRPIWTGGISFGLIFIPVKLYSATESISIDLDLLSKKDLNPIRYARIDTETGKEVAWKDVVKGYEFKKGDYVVLENEDFEKIALHRSKTIEIESFVDKDEIDPVYYEKPYYLEPDKGADKTYFLLMEALKKTNKVGIAEFIFKNREHLAAIEATDGMLKLSQLRYESELREASQLDIPKKINVKEKELDLAVKLINEMADDFKASNYTDDYMKALKKIIDLKKSKKPIKIKNEKAQSATDISEVIKELEKSLEQYSVSKK